VRNLGWLFFCYALFGGVPIVVNPVSAVAQEQYEHPDHSVLAVNDIVAKNLFNGAEQDVAFLALIKMTVGHLVAADFAIERGDLDEARQHLNYPIAGDYPEIASLLRKRKLTDAGIVRALQSGAVDKTRTEIYDAIVEIEGWQHAIDPKKMVMDCILADTAVLLMRTAVTKYDKAFKANQTVNTVEYYEGNAFVTEATTLIEDAEYEWKIRDPVAYKQLQLALQELQTLWPGEVPTHGPLTPLSTMLELVSTIERQINDIRNND
jgi:hypothetical protein